MNDKVIVEINIKGYSINKDCLCYEVDRASYLFHLSGIDGFSKAVKFIDKVVKSNKGLIK